MACRRGIRFIQYRIVGIELCDSFHPTRGVAFAKHPREVRLHEAVIVDGLIDHLPPPQSQFERHNAVELQPITARRTGSDSAVGLGRGGGYPLRPSKTLAVKPLN